MSEHEIAAMPLEIAEAILAIMKEIKTLAKNEKNDYAKYPFASVDGFYDGVRPLLAKHGLMIVPNEASSEVREFTTTDEKGTTKLSAWLIQEWVFVLFHRSGVAWQYPLTRTIMVRASMGAQAYGAAQSYVMKQFERLLFQISTGDVDEDVDEHRPVDLPKHDSRSAKWKGPLGKTKLKEALRAFGKEMDACTDADQFSALVESERALFEQCEADLPQFWEGDEKINFAGWKQFLATKETELSNMEGAPDPAISWANQFMKEIDAFDDLVALNAHVKLNEHNFNAVRASDPSRADTIQKVIENKRGFLAQAPGGK